jgi:hypothetical protein
LIYLLYVLRKKNRAKNYKKRIVKRKHKWWHFCFKIFNFIS